MVSSEIIDKFKRLYLEKFNIVLTQEEATQMANDLVNLIQVLLKPDPYPTTNVEKERRQDESITTPTT